MICDICNKNPATVHFKHVSNGKVSELRLCEKCAGEKGINLYAIEDNLLGNQQFGLAELLAGFTEPVPVRKKGVSKKCRNCGITYKDFMKTGRMGCSECYKIFSEELLPLLKRLQGTTQHAGKTPAKGNRKTTVEKTLRELKDELKRAVHEEEYEKAAVIRDRIKAVEGRRKKGGAA